MSEMELSAELRNADQLVSILCGQSFDPEQLLSGDREVIRFICQNFEIMEQAQRMRDSFQSSLELEKQFKVNRDLIVNDLINYYLEQFPADDFFASKYKELIIKYELLLSIVRNINKLIFMVLQLDYVAN